MITIVSKFYLPSIGKLSLDGGIVSVTTSMKTARDSSTVISRDTFSPLSTGSIKPWGAAPSATRMHGNIKVRRKK